MSRESLVFIIGFLVFIVPFLGIPRNTKEFVFIGAGILLMLLGFSLRRNRYLRLSERPGGERHTAEFTESSIHNPVIEHSNTASTETV